MKKWSALWLFGILMIAVLAGCGAKSKEDVMEDLGKKVDGMKSYQTEATMTFQHNGKKQTYQADISYQQPGYYRVALSDGKKENQQMILKNREGVFVLTPELNKSYRFESDWPNNRSQAYLYHSLAKDILNDPNPNFKAGENGYVFDTKTNYNTTELANQSISLKKDLTPSSVRIMDKDKNVVMTVTFKDFKVNPQLEKSTFDVKRNMTAAKIEETETASAEKKSFQIKYPTAVIGKTKLSEIKPEESRAGEKYILKYSGEKPFTLIESKSRTASSSMPTFATGDPANLGFTIGSANGSGNNQVLSWSHDGTDYYLASNKLTREELMAVARSVTATVIK
ncbi:outer membrane lipoprotein carrier protein LolA [Sporolactobacillus sp. THM7-7]|nr:outer membrane lipoprotein carrier protein LolA [Sporolactobacillus sp. THM7-7]